MRFPCPREARRRSHRAASTGLARVALAAACLSALAAPLAAAKAETSLRGQTVTLAASGSAEEAGILGHLVAMFKAKTGIRVKVIRCTIGEAETLARSGKVDVVFTNDYESEKRLVAERLAVERRDVMYSDLVIVGPEADPASVGGMSSVIDAVRMIATAKAPFVSRGDDSGTHRAERRFFEEAGVGAETRAGEWYKTARADTRRTLEFAAKSKAYTLSERGAWLAFKNLTELSEMVAGDPRMINQYGIMLVNPERHPRVKKAAGLALIEWLTSEAGQKAIADFQIGEARPYVPDFGQRTQQDADQPEKKPEPPKKRRKRKRRRKSRGR